MYTQDTFEAPHSQLWQELSWQPSLSQLRQFKTLQKLLRKWNSEANLTRLVEGEDFWVAQVFDTLWTLKEELKTPQRKLECIDVGSGCGVPGLLVAIALPAAKVTLLDSVKRKTSALKEISNKMGLSSQIKTLTQRVVVVGQVSLYRGRFDLAMARAVGPTPVVCEYLIPLLNPTGEALLFRGKWTEQEEKVLKTVAKQLNAMVSKIECLHLPAERGIRHQIRLKRNGLCPKTYPRPVGVPQKKPLGD